MADGSYAESQALCNGSAAAIIFAKVCTIGMNDLIGFTGKIVGELIKVRYSASNSEGFSPASEANSDSAVYQS